MTCVSGLVNKYDPATAILSNLCMCEILFLKSCLFPNCDSLLKFVCKNFQLIRKTESEAEINERLTMK